MAPWYAKVAMMAGVILLSCLLGSCADVLFERSPYAIRALDVVYSQQEDLTFLVWRLRESANPDKVSFELWSEGNYRPIDLTQAPFPATPYPCDFGYLCFQYQLPGRVDWPEEVLPLRSIQVDEGIYAGSVPRRRAASMTFDVSPVAIDRNETIELRRFDWFNLEGIPLERSYEWQFVDSSGRYNEGPPEIVCAQPSASRWREADEVMAVDYGWVERPSCLVARPKRREAPGAEVARVLPPTAELFWERQDHRPGTLEPTTIYIYLFDLLVRGSERCLRAQREIMRTIDGQFESRSPGAVRLGPFFPQDPVTGEVRDGCSQASSQDYPITQMIDAIKQAAAQLEPDNTRLVFIYVNNVELPPSERVLFQLFELGVALTSIPNILPYALAIASNAILQLEAWNDRIGWRTIDDDTFTGDMRAWGRATLPFKTLDHRFDTRILIPRPQESRRAPLAFKICSVTPENLSGVYLGAEAPLQPPPLRRFYRWPDEDVPRYSNALDEQILVPSREYRQVRSSIVVEVCERFCEMPFRAASGANFTSWLGVPNCQWERDR